ncbi:MAG: phosphopentomutase [Eubacteriales bacterium]|nr:phosphopentomutase [Eubacteriales bacterium]
MSVKRLFLIVLDSFGVGNAPDAADFGDEGANTLGTIFKSEKYHTPNMCKIGFFNIDGVTCEPKEKSPIGAYGRLTEQSKGKDTTIGHWEIAGVVSEKPMPTYPNGFPKEILDEFSKRVGRGVLCNKPYSGTDVIRDYGEEHEKTGKLIVYTSVDSVFQIAAHEDVVPLEELYEDCRIAREILQGEHGVGRVIARPFIGSNGDYTRTPHRHDFSLVPPQTMMDVLVENGFASKGVGKIYDIFAGKNIQTTVSIENNVDGMNKTMEIQKEDFEGLCFVNLVDFDMLYGHRNNIDGYANAATVFDEQLAVFMENMKEDDVLLITADHGCDPGYKGTDHSRERVPVLVYGAPIKAGVNLGTRSCFSDIAATVLDMFGIEEKGNIKGESFWQQIRNTEA